MRTRNHFLRFYVVALLGACSTLLLQPSHVSAVSEYDAGVSATDIITVNNSSSTPHDVSATYLSLMRKHCAHINAKISEYIGADTKAITITKFVNGEHTAGFFWTTSTSSSQTELAWTMYDQSRGLFTLDVPAGTQFVELVQSNYSDDYYCHEGSTNNPYRIATVESLQLSNSHTSHLYLSTFDPNYPPGYEGPLLEDGSVTDNDEDGLTLIQEAQQGTSDNNTDSDEDGISDFKESIWYTERDEVFCNTATTPHTCAYPDPITQDIYVEIDWIEDLVSSRVFKPSSTQLSLVEAMFASEGINFHADTGQFGGGNKLPDYIEYLPRNVINGTPDFLDYRNGGDGTTRNFAENRQGIWRYTIYGNKFSNETGNSESSGWSAVLGDNLFIAGGAIEDLQNLTNTDRAVAGTIAHELGHSLCLSNVRAYLEQAAGCIYTGIDNRSGRPPLNNPDSYFDLINYESIMNYRYQLTDIDDMGVVNYSHGSDSWDNHDDWSAVKAHVSGFTKTHTLYIEYGARITPKTLNGHVIIESPSPKELIEYAEKEKR